MNFTYGYARVSTREQNLATQFDTLQKAGCDKIYQDKITGVSTSRPQLDNLLASLRPGDTVVVTEMSRLSRSFHHLVELMRVLQEKQVNLRALAEGLDSTGAQGQAFMFFWGIFADLFLKDLKRRTSHGRELAIEAGTHMGRRKGVDQKALARVRTAMQQKLSTSQIVELTGIPETTVKRYKRAIQAEKRTTADDNI